MLSTSASLSNNVKLNMETQDRREKYIAKLACTAAISIKKNASRENINLTDDYISAMFFAGVLIQKHQTNTDSSDPDFGDTIAKDIPYWASFILSDEITNIDQILFAMKDPVSTEKPKVSLQYTRLAFSIFKILLKLSEDYKLTIREIYKVISFCSALALLSNSKTNNYEEDISVLLCNSCLLIPEYEEIAEIDKDVFGDLH